MYELMFPARAPIRKTHATVITSIRFLPCVDQQMLFQVGWHTEVLVADLTHMRRPFRMRKQVSVETNPAGERTMAV